MLNKEELKLRMRKLLEHFNDERIQITDDTIHKQVLATDDGATPTLSSKRLYKAIIRQKLYVNENPDEPWPGNWMDMSVDTLAGELTA
ncbi:MAG: hypothetical protein NTU88_10700 [Armatimonadetes bacterium]|nr:hypothetical protein [Armatimonadota bacterium]